MTEFRSRDRVDLTSVLRRNCAGIILALGLPVSSVASPSSEEWIEFTRVCEAVISEQSVAPFKEYSSAPFMSGKPGQKEYSVYNASMNLVATARVIQEQDWVLCYIRESDEDRSRYLKLMDQWSNLLGVAFPQPEYVWTGNRNPEVVSPIVVRCEGEDLARLVYGSLEADFHFRVVVTGELNRGMSNPCGKREL